MELKFYSTPSNDNVINKTLNDGPVININLKRDTDIINPVIILQVDGVDYSEFNYAEIPDLDRKYFIRDVQKLSQKLIQLSLQVDVLESYKHHILKSDARLTRSLKFGDYQNIQSMSVNLGETVTKTVTNYYSDGVFPSGVSIVMSTVGGV